MKSSMSIPWRWAGGLVRIRLMGARGGAPASAAPSQTGDDLYVPPPQPGAKRQIAELISQGDTEAASLIRAMTDTPQAVWFERGTPTSVEQDVRLTVTRAAAERFAMLNHAVDALADLPNVTTYLDGTHSAWLGSGDIAHRLVQAGVADADGFYLNVSNYQYTVNNVQYGRWISQCIAYATGVVEGDFFNCPNQYWNGGPFPAKIADLLGEWTGVALDRFGEWSDDSDDPELNTSGINLRYSNMLGDVEPTARYVIDTSRNGQGPWSPPAYPDPQDWCNPPDRGLGRAPTLDTGEPLLAAYLWVKTPGESDGECTRGLGPAGETVDPGWGMIDPGAGGWFPEMALELATNADPPLQP